MQAARQIARRVLVAPQPANQVRHMSGSLSQAEEEKQMKLWRVISLIAVPACVVLAFQKLTKEHEHPHEPPAYPYLHIRAKQFPWGDCALFDVKCWKDAKES